MTVTAPQWTVIRRDENKSPTRIETLLGGDPFYIYYIFNNGWHFVCEDLRISGYLPYAATAEQAITEAVVTIAQHLARLSAELGAIPITLPEQS